MQAENGTWLMMLESLMTFSTVLVFPAAAGCFAYVKWSRTNEEVDRKNLTVMRFWVDTDEVEIIYYNTEDGVPLLETIWGSYLSRQAFAFCECGGEHSPGLDRWVG